MTDGTGQEQRDMWINEFFGTEQWNVRTFLLLHHPTKAQVRLHFDGASSHVNVMW
jgi:hypothetical protein